jgi:hypothetical protein
MMLCPIYPDGIRFVGRVRNLKADLTSSCEEHFCGVGRRIRIVEH